MTTTEMPTLADDLLVGAPAIAREVFGRDGAAETRRIYHLARTGGPAGAVQDGWASGRSQVEAAHPRRGRVMRDDLTDEEATADAAAAAARRRRAEKGCARLLRRLHEHHPEHAPTGAFCQKDLVQ
jgi:hypothetical protein